MTSLRPKEFLRHAVLAIVGSTALAAAPVGGAHASTRHHATVIKQITKTIRSVEVDSDSGAVTIATGTVTTVTADESWNNHRPALDINVRHGVLTIRSRCDAPASFGHVNVDITSALNNCADRLTLVVPEDAAITAHTDGGRITSHGIHAAQQLRSGGGRVKVARAVGHLDASTGGGGVVTRSVRGKQILHSGGGGIIARAAQGDIHATTGGSGIQIYDFMARSIYAHAGGGAVTVIDRAKPQRLVATTGGGAVAVDVPSGVYAVTATSGSGRKHVSVSGVTVDQQAARTITAHSGGGAVTVMGSTPG